MKIYSKLVFAALPMLLAGKVMALDLSETILCASLDVYECVDGSGCNEVLAEDVNAPTFFRVNVEEKQVMVSKAGEPTEVEHYETIGGRVILQGVDASRQDAEVGVGWTVAIEEESGRMVSTVTIDQGAIVIFGACTE